VTCKTQGRDVQFGKVKRRVLAINNHAVFEAPEETVGGILSQSQTTFTHIFLAAQKSQYRFSTWRPDAQIYGL
jgi:hypothetical protein